MDTPREQHYGFPSQLTTDIPLEFETDPTELDLGTVYYESTYQQLTRDRDDLRQRYDREKRERESLEMKFHDEFDQKVYFEEKLSELSRNLLSNEEELHALRLENSNLKAQFGQLRSAIQTRVSSDAVGMSLVGMTTSASMSNSGVSFIANSTNEASSVGGSTEMYKQEVALLAQENELFKHIIDVIDKQEHSKTILDERVSGQSNEGLNRWFENENECVARLKREKAQLEDRVRELERSSREQERMLEDVHNKAEENLRVYKRESKVLENELCSQSAVVEDCEVQMSQLKQSYEDEIQQLEVNLEMEVTNNKQLQEQTHQLEKSICTLEEERKELLLKIEEAYKAENGVVEERIALEESYSRDVIELRRNVEEEIQKKAEMSVEIERLISELIESDKQKKEMEARFFHEAQELKSQLGKEREEIYSYLNGATVSQPVMMQSNVAQQTQQDFQLVASGNQMLTKEEDWKMKLSEEVRKKEKLEEENKKLLYQINDLLEQNVGGGATKHSLDYDVNTRSHLGNNKNTKGLDAEIDELKKHCRVLERDAKKKKELENKNIELSEEIEELMVKKDEVIRKQKQLVKELENSLSSVQYVEDKNRRLSEEVENLSRKIRQMEDNFRNEKEKCLRNYTNDKTLQINELLSEKESIERKYSEQVKINRSMQAEINSFETKICDLERTKERLERKTSEITSHFTEEINFEKGRTKTMNDELHNSVEVFKKQTEQLETSLYEKKKKYDEEIRILEEEKQRIRADLESEKETYRRRFEEERKTMERRINEIETKLRQQNGVNGDLVPDQVTCTLYDESSTNGTVNQPGGFRSSSHQTISDFKMQIDTLRTENKELQATLRDTERKHRRKTDDLEYDNEQKIRKVKVKIEEEFKRKIDDYERQIDDLKMKITDSQERVPSLGCASDKRDYNDMSYLAAEHTEQMDDLRRQIKLQMEAFENEKQNLKKELQDERKNPMRDKKGEVALLYNTIHKLTEEVKKLKQENETILHKLKNEKGFSNSRITEMSDIVTKVRNECQQRLRRGRENAQKSVNDLMKNLAATESRLRTIEETHRREKHQLEVKFEYQKTELEQVTSSLESRLRESLQMEYRASLNKEREKYEETLRVLRKEITSLQEQRKQIQTKLTSQSTQSSYSLLMDKSISSKNMSFYKSEANVEFRISREAKQMENRILDLEREVEVLKKEKADIKASYRQEKVQIQAEFDRERDRLEEKYRRQIELKRRLQKANTQIQSTALVAKKWDRSPRASRDSSDATELLHDRNFAVETKSSALETQISILKDRMVDIEDRQKRSMNSKTRKNTSVRFCSGLERSRDQRRLSSRLSSSMLDLSSSAQLRGGTLEKSRIALSSHSTGRLNREAKETRSFLSQSQSDLRSLTQGAWARDDQFLNSGRYGSAGSSSITLGRPEILPSRSASFYRGRTLSGFDASRGSGYLQMGSSFRNDQYFLPSVGILGGPSQARGGAFGGSLIGTYTGGSGSYSGLGFQRLTPGPTFYGQGAVSGFDGRLHHSSNLSSLHQQLPTQVEGSSSTAAFAQASVGVNGSSDWNSVSVTSPTDESHQITASQPAVGCTSEGASKESQSSDREVKDTTSAGVNATSQQTDNQSADEYNIIGCKVDHRDTGPHEESYVEPAQHVSF